MARDLRPVKIIMTVVITSTMLKRDKKKKQINKEKQIDNKILDLLLNIFALRN